MESWDTFSEDVNEANRNRHRSRCALGTLLSMLPDDARAFVETALENEALTSTAIAKALSRRTVNPPRAFTVNRHRRGDCTCSKAE